MAFSENAGDGLVREFLNIARLAAAIQRIVCVGNEVDIDPNDAGGDRSGDDGDEQFLEKGMVHG